MMKIRICRTKTFYIHIILMVLCVMAYSVDMYGQNTLRNNELRKYLDKMFENVDKTSVPTGFLRDYAIEDEDLDQFTGDGLLSDKNVCTTDRYKNLLNTINSAAVTKLSKQSINTAYCNLEGVKGNRYLQLSVMAFKYAQIKASALNDGLFILKKEQLFRTERAGNPYILGNLFAGCCLDNIVNTSNVTFILPSSLVFGNAGIKKIEIDYGNGYYDISEGKTVRANLKNGQNEIRIRAILSDDKVLITHTCVTVTSNITKTRSSQIDTVSIDKRVKITGSDYGGIRTTADVSIHYALGHHSLIKPLIIVEGFDPRCISSHPQGKIDINCINKYLSYLDMAGLDIVYVDWEQSEEYLQANAYTLIEVIKWVNEEKKASGSSVPNIILGHSMGGIIARYALKTMENQKIQHDVGTYISYDAPHLGAHIPIGVLYAYDGIKTFLKEKGIINKLLPSKINDYIKLGDAMAYSASAQQMLVYSVDGAGHFNNQEHIIWQKELNNLGFPKGDPGKRFKMLAVANGSYQNLAVPEKYLETDFSAGSDVLSLIPLLDLGVSISLNDVVACLLSVLPGRTYISGDFDVYPAKSAGQQVTHIQMKYKKTFLWTIPISKTVFSYDRNCPGGYLFDTYPSSSFPTNIKEANDSNEISWGQNKQPLYDVDMDVKLCKGIPFIPTSSALAYGNGIDSSPAYYFQAPKGEESPFGENYYVEDSQQSHLYISPGSMKWIFSMMLTSIMGPSVGYEGARYKLSNAFGNVSWSTSNSQIATIDQTGKLSIHGNGVVSVIANYNEASYSQLVMVGLPRFVLKASHEPNGYKINAECIDNEYTEQLQDLNGVIKFRFGVKFPSKEIKWIETESPNLQVQLDPKDSKVIVLFKVIDQLGNESPVQTIEVNSQDVYAVINSKLYVDAQGNLYKENKNKYSYTSGRVYVRYKDDLPEKYKERKWMVTSAMVLSPYLKTQNISARDGGPLIKNIIPEDELNYIIKGSEDGQVYNYMIILLNYKGEYVQFVPLSITYKTNINN